MIFISLKTASVIFFVFVDCLCDFFSFFKLNFCQKEQRNLFLHCFCHSFNQMSLVITREEIINNHFIGLLQFLNLSLLIMIRKILKNPERIKTHIYILSFLKILWYLVLTCTGWCRHVLIICELVWSQWHLFF